MICEKERGQEVEGRGKVSKVLVGWNETLRFSSPNPNPFTAARGWRFVFSARYLLRFQQHISLPTNCKGQVVEIC